MLFDELVTRLQRTIIDFNEEVKEIMGALKLSSDRRNQIMHDLMEGNEASSEDSVANEADKELEDTPEMSAWEKRLERK